MEKCCTDPARKIGGNGLFQTLLEESVKAFHTGQAQRIVTISPHCYDIVLNEYPDGMGKFKIQHYTEFLAEMMKGGHLLPTKKADKIVTYHDPCYPRRRNQFYEAPGRLMKVVGQGFVEMKRNRENSLCCGDGGRKDVDRG